MAWRRRIELAESLPSPIGPNGHRYRVAPSRTIHGTSASVSPPLVGATAEEVRREDIDRQNRTVGQHPSRQSFGTARRIRAYTKNARPEATWAQPLSREELS